MSDPGLISVRTQVVLDTLVGSISDGVAARVEEPLAAPLESALAAAGGDIRLPRLGYLARALEVERFERARQPMPWLAEELERHRGDGIAWSEAAASLATELANAEPAERPDPGDALAVSWRVPGPGGHVRHYLAIRAAGDAGVPASPEAKRGWLKGFLIHCIQEAAPPERRTLQAIR
jgi:hypothetical protein